MMDVVSTPAASPEPSKDVPMEHDSASKPVVAKKASPKRRASKKRKRAKKDPNMPKRGLSSYMFFAKEYRPKLLKEDPSLSIGDVGKKTGAKWKEMTNEDKEPYAKLAAEDKLRYQREMEQYTPPEASPEVASPAASKKAVSKKSKTPSKKSNTRVKSPSGKQGANQRGIMSFFSKRVPGASPKPVAKKTVVAKSPRQDQQQDQGGKAVTKEVEVEAADSAAEPVSTTRESKVSRGFGSPTTPSVQAASDPKSGESFDDVADSPRPTKKQRRRAVVESSDDEDEDASADTEMVADADDTPTAATKEDTSDPAQKEDDTDVSMVPNNAASPPDSDVASTPVAVKPVPMSTSKPKPKPKAKATTSFFTSKKASSKPQVELTEDEVKKLFVSDKKGRFSPAKRTPWKTGQATTKRLEKEDILCNFLRCVIATSPQDLLVCVNMAANRLAPAFDGVEIGIGDSIMIKAIVECTGRKKRDVKAQVHKLGDLGLVAEASKAKQAVLFTPARLTVKKVFDTLFALANMTGNKSQNKKLASIRKMMVACKGKEARYLVRGLQGKLRIGLAERTVLTALAQAVTLTPPTPESGVGEDYEPIDDLRTTMSADKVSALLEKNDVALKQAHSEMPTYTALIGALLHGGIEEMKKRCTLRPGIPVSPMLAKPTRGVSQVLDRFANIRFVCEWKYDGERGQIHCLPDGTVKLFSRSSEDSTPKFPDVAAFIPEACNEGTKSFVLDGEIVAFDRKQNAILPFQQLSTRARKGATVENITIQVMYVVFDILYLNGKSLLHETLEERKRLLAASFHDVPGKFQFAEALQCSELDEIQAFLEKAVKGNCEGLMVKTLVENSMYEPTKRSFNWLKLKRDYMDGLADSFDLVPIGGYLGKGKRAGVYGAYLLATYSEDDEEFQAITKVGTGFSDEVLSTHTKFFKDKDLIRTCKPLNVNLGGCPAPDVWLEPGTVWEVKAADLSISPIYRAAFGLVDVNKGIALRFPRFIRVRDDKEPEGCTNAEQVAQMYRDQGLAVSSSAAATRRDEGLL